MASLFFKRDITRLLVCSYPNVLRCGDGSVVRRVLRSDGCTSYIRKRKHRQAIDRLAEQAVRENRFDIICLVIGYVYMPDDLLLVACQAGRRDMVRFLIRQHDMRDGNMIRSEHLQAVCQSRRLDILQDVIHGTYGLFDTFEVTPEDVFDMWKCSPDGVRLILTNYADIKALRDYAVLIGNTDFVEFIDGQKSYDDAYIGMDF